MISDEERALIEQIKGGRELEHNEKLAAFGDRFIGSPVDQAAIDYVTGEVDALRLEIQNTPICVPTFLNTSETVLRTEVTGQTYDAISPYFSPSTPEGGLEAEVAPVIGGKDEDYRDIDVDGKSRF